MPEPSAKFRVQSCESKMRYDSGVHASSIADRIWLRESRAMVPYLCNLCGGWHLTTSHDPQARRVVYSESRDERRRAAESRRQRQRRLGRRR